MKDITEEHLYFMMSIIISGNPIIEDKHLFSSQIKLAQDLILSGYMESITVSKRFGETTTTKMTQVGIRIATSRRRCDIMDSATTTDERFGVTITYKVTQASLEIATSMGHGILDSAIETVREKLQRGVQC